MIFTNGTERKASITKTLYVATLTVSREFFIEDMYEIRNDDKLDYECLEEIEKSL